MGIWPEDKRTTEDRKARGRPPGNPADHPLAPEPASSIAAQPPDQGPTSTCMVADAADSRQEAGARSRCAECGAVADPLARLRQLLSERHEAWRAGRRVRRELLQAIELAAFFRGWEQRGAYEAERGAACTP